MLLPYHAFKGTRQKIIREHHVTACFEFFTHRGQFSMSVMLVRIPFKMTL